MSAEERAGTCPGDCFPARGGRFDRVEEVPTHFDAVVVSLEGIVEWIHSCQLSLSRPALRLPTQSKLRSTNIPGRNNLRIAEKIQLMDSSSRAVKAIMDEHG